ncbi:hypothetical protein ON010_g15147 [Phytophthora cinnamomi]|nr:hypothetical protein ON010_g15147 [Phytophthora cinnamomi]
MRSVKPGPHAVSAKKRRPLLINLQTAPALTLLEVPPDSEDEVNADEEVVHSDNSIESDRGGGVQSKALAPRGGASPEGVDGRIENDKRTGAAEASEAIFRSKRFGAWEDGGAGRLKAMLFKDWSASRDDRETEINMTVREEAILDAYLKRYLGLPAQMTVLNLLFKVNTTKDFGQQKMRRLMDDAERIQFDGSFVLIFVFASHARAQPWIDSTLRLQNPLITLKDSTVMDRAVVTGVVGLT